jgi:hypothetical protein
MRKTSKICLGVEDLTMKVSQTGGTTKLLCFNGSGETIVTTKLYGISQGIRKQPCLREMKSMPSQLGER